MFTVWSKKDLIWYLEKVVETPALQHHFSLYQKRLIEMAEENIKTKATINSIFDLANDLFIKKLL